MLCQRPRSCQSASECRYWKVCASFEVLQKLAEKVPQWSTQVFNMGQQHRRTVCCCQLTLAVGLLQPWFFRWKYGTRPWNAPYLKMVPDDLHTVYGGVLGSHFLNILDAVAEIHPDGKAAFLSLMNIR